MYLHANCSSGHWTPQNFAHVSTGATYTHQRKQRLCLVRCAALHPFLPTNFASPFHHNKIKKQRKTSMCSIHKVIAMELETAIPLHTIRDMPHIGSLWSIGAVHRDLCPLCTGLAPSHSLKKATAKSKNVPMHTTKWRAQPGCGSNLPAYADVARNHVASRCLSRLKRRQVAALHFPLEIAGWREKDRQN